MTQPTGDAVTTYRIVNTEPFVWNEISVQEYVIWFREEWVPVGTQAMTAVAGFGGTSGQQFTNLGEPVVIEVPAVGCCCLDGIAWFDGNEPGCPP